MDGKSIKITLFSIVSVIVGLLFIFTIVGVSAPELIDSTRNISGSSLPLSNLFDSIILDVLMLMIFLVALSFMIFFLVHIPT